MERRRCDSQRAFLLASLTLLPAPPSDGEGDALQGGNEGDAAGPSGVGPDGGGEFATDGSTQVIRRQIEAGSEGADVRRGSDTQVAGGGGLADEDSGGAEDEAGENGDEVRLEGEQDSGE
jgi:hypothetical protein